MTIIEARARQSDSTVKVGEGDENYLSSTRLGQLFTADWKTKLMLAGRCWRLTPGAFPANADITDLTGGGNATTLELELPEIAIGVDLGYYLIPIEVDVSVFSDQDTDQDYARIVVLMDRTLGVPTSVGTGTIETMENLLDGGPSFPGRAYSGISSSDITDPTMDELLAYKTQVGIQVTAAGTMMSGCNLHYAPKTPSIVAGPCGLYIYWGGTVAAIGLASVVVAVVPQGWVQHSG